jgi:hypothetical protein
VAYENGSKIPGVRDRSLIEAVKHGIEVVEMRKSTHEMLATSWAETRELAVRIGSLLPGDLPHAHAS